MFSVNARLLLVCMFAFSMVFAAMPNRANFNFNVRTQNEETSESVEVNFRDNFVQITTQGQGQEHPTIIVHDYTQGLNLFKQNDQCFMIDRFQDIPQNIEDWLKVQKVKVGDTVQTDGNVLYRDYFYKALPFSLDRSTLPAVVQRICPHTILVLVLEGTREGETAHRQTLEQLGDNTGRGTILLPGRSLPKRVKRQSWGGSFGGGNSNGGFVRGSLFGDDGAGTSGRLDGRYNFDRDHLNLGGSLTHEQGDWSSTFRGNYDSLGGGSLGGQVNYNDGPLNWGLNADHNLDNHNTNLGAGVNYDNGNGLSWGASGNYNTGSNDWGVRATLNWRF